MGATRLRVFTNITLAKSPRCNDAKLRFLLFHSFPNSTRPAFLIEQAARDFHYQRTKADFSARHEHVNEID
jgi:hypothetical protein